MKKEYFAIPNLMGYFRILMIPVFLILYCNADTQEDYIIAFAALAISMLTDFFDGKIARKFNMVTEFGKSLDPVADKLTQGALALAATIHYPFMVWFFVIFLCKELYMVIMGMYLFKTRHVLIAAKWYGKVCTGAMDVGMFILLLFPQMSNKEAQILILIMIAFMCLSLIKYIQLHVSLLKEKEKICAS